MLKNMNEKIKDNVQALHDLGKLAVREFLSIHELLADWCSSALTASLTNNAELKEKLLAEANELLAPQQFDNFDDAYHNMNDICTEFNKDLYAFWLKIDKLTFSSLVGIDQTCHKADRK